MTDTGAGEDHNTTWSDERTALLTRLWAGGYSASQIAAEIGGLSRNAVIGKIHRLDLPGREVKFTSPRGFLTREEKAERQAARRAKRESRPPQPVIAEPEARMVALLDLEHGDCRYPFGNGPFFFCGHPATHGSYCKRHHRVTHG